VKVSLTGQLVFTTKSLHHEKIIFCAILLIISAATFGQQTKPYQILTVVYLYSYRSALNY